MAGVPDRGVPQRARRLGPVDGRHAQADQPEDFLAREHVHAELADLVAGRRPGRTRQDEITIFDSTGTALQDVAAAVAVYETARASGRGTEIALDD